MTCPTALKYQLAMFPRLLLSILIAVGAVSAQKYDGPKPPKPDLPYIKHATTLLPTEAVEAKPQKKKDSATYVIEGANSPARTPLAAPIFLFDRGKIDPASLQLFQLESKNGHRESGEKKAEPFRIEVTPLDGTLYRIEPYDGLEPGEYALSVSGSNQVFCFAVF